MNLSTRVFLLLWCGILPAGLLAQSDPPPDPVGPTNYQRYVGNPTEPISINLSTVFNDDGGFENLVFEVTIEANTHIDSYSITDGVLTFTFLPGITGSANVVVRATDVDDQFADYEFVVRVVPLPNPIVRINSGGYDYGSWSVDDFYSDGHFAPEQPVEIGGTDDDYLFQTERWGPGFSYQIPLPEPGYYSLKLLFAEIFLTLVGDRIFNVSAEGEPLLVNYDIVQVAGARYQAVIEQFDSVYVSDGSLTLNFTAVVDNAKISAIEVAQHVSDPVTNVAPTVTNPGNRMAVSNTSFELQVYARDQNLNDVLTYDASGLPTGLSIDPATGKISGTVQSVNGDYNVTVSADDGNGGLTQVSFLISVVDLIDFVLRINAGGSAITFGDEVWGADDYFVKGDEYSVVASIANTDNDEIYHTERYDELFSYEIPVPGDGVYFVTLHFAEISRDYPGERIFNVDVEDGQGTLTNYDIVQAAGGAETAVRESFKVNVEDGYLSIDFNSVVDFATVSAIEFSACIEPTIATFTATESEICAGSTTLLTVNGNLGSATSWNLYAGSCGGTLITTNTTGVFEVNPDVTTTYFVRGEGGCTTAPCTSLTVIVNTVNTGVTADGTTLTASAAGAEYQWIDCADDSEIEGATNQTFSPSNSGSYKVKVTEDGCTSTSECIPVCFSPVIVSVTPSSAEVCQGELVSLTVDGELGGATSWVLYAGSCDGTPVESNATGMFEVNPAVSTTYFVRGEGGCVTNASCSSIAIVVNTVDTGISVGPNSLTAAAEGAAYQWINCADNSDILGATEREFTPAANGEYAVRVTQNGCTSVSSCVGFFACISPSIESVVASSTEVCPGDNVTVTVSGELGSATNWHLYSGSCGGTFVSANAVGVFEVDAEVTTTYFVRGEGGCVVSGECSSVTVTVNTVNTTVTRSGNTLTSAAEGATYQWVNCTTSADIAGATSKNFSPEESGVYAVRVTQNGCTQTSDCSDFVVVGVAENLSELISVYPNPGKSKVRIDLPVQATVLVVELTDAQGRSVLRDQKRNTSSIEMSTEQVRDGMYLLHIRTENLTKTVKFIVN